jgi:ATP/ADP translocase/HEAT repeat protein
MAVAHILKKLGVILGIKKGEFVKAFSLFLYLLLVIACYVVSKTVRDSLFLTKFGALNLPYVTIGIAVVLGPIVALYIKIARRVKQRFLVSSTLLFFISNVALFWWLFPFQPEWLYPVIYIWAGIFGVIAPMQVWTLSNFVLTTREAKRLFGFIGSGGVLGGITGGFFSSWMVSLIGTENLLLSIAAFLLVCVLLVNLIWLTSVKSAPQTEREPSPSPEQAPSNFGQSLSLITKSRYLLLIAGIITIASIVTSLVDFQFKWVAKQSLNSKDELTAFFGNFYGYLGLGAFLLQLFLTRRLMQNLGIGFTIFLLPVGLLLGSVVLIFFLTLWAAVMLKGPDQLFKHSVDKSTVELLYLPVPPQTKAAVKPFIDTIIWRLSDGIAGVIFLLLTSVLALGVQQVGLVNIAIIGLWLMIAYLTRRGYVDALRLAVYRQDLDPEKVSVSIQDPATIAGLLKSLDGADTRDVLYVFDFMDLVRDKRKLVSPLEKFLHHEAPEVRAKVLNLLFEVGDERLAAKVKELIEDEAIEVQVEAIQFVSAHSGQDPMEMTQSFLDDPDIRIKGAAACFLVINRGDVDYYVLAREILDEMLQSGDATTRREAARMLGVIRGPSALHNKLLGLLKDPSLDVVQQAIVSAGKVQRREFVPLILNHLGHSKTRAAARETLAKYGIKILGTLRDYLIDEGTDTEIRKEIPRAISDIGSQEGVDILTHNLQEKDPHVRQMVIKGLNKLRVRSSELHFQKDLIRGQFLSEVKEYYDTLNLLHAYSLGGPWPASQQPNGDLLRGCLEERLETSLERLFRLLGLIYAPDDLYQAYYGLLSQNSRTKANAVELLDNLLEPGDKRWLLPIIDDEVSLGHQLDLGGSLGVVRYQDRVAALTRLVESPDPILVLGAIDAIYTQHLDALYEKIEQATHDPHPVVRETAAKVRTLIQSHQVGPAGDGTQAARPMPPDAKAPGESGDMKTLTTLEKIKHLQNVDLFAHCKMEQLFRIAAIAHEVTFDKGDIILQENGPGDCLYCIVSGNVKVTKEGSTESMVFGEGEAIGVMAILDGKPWPVTVTAQEDIAALKINGEDFYDLLADNMEIARGIFSHLTHVLRDTLQRL